jgi:hypothetical protein
MAVEDQLTQLNTRISRYIQHKFDMEPIVIPHEGEPAEKPTLPPSFTRALIKQVQPFAKLISSIMNNQKQLTELQIHLNNATFPESINSSFKVSKQILDLNENLPIQIKTQALTKFIEDKMNKIETLATELTMLKVDTIAKLKILYDTTKLFDPASLPPATADLLSDVNNLRKTANWANFLDSFTKTITAMREKQQADIVKKLQKKARAPQAEEMEVEIDAAKEIKTLKAQVETLTKKIAQASSKNGNPSVPKNPNAGGKQSKNKKRALPIHLLQTRIQKPHQRRRKKPRTPTKIKSKEKERTRKETDVPTKKCQIVS